METEQPQNNSTANVKNLKENGRERLKDTTKIFPKITDKNVVAFLTNYGEEHPETRAKITTRLGEIEIELFEDTPLHRANFVYLAKRKYFDDTFFHRVTPKFIIQGGTSDNSSTQENRAAIGNRYRIPSETKNGRKHLYGTISGAKYYRENEDNKSEPFEFFIFLGQPISKKHLDGKYTVYGRVTKGMDIVEKISEVEKDKAEWPLVNVTITVEVF
ncbi:peptidylprolyl isomerase [Patiriisocius sp. Uisw_017]|uniref:peptidylprolyl isomerase n=1 Tax=Patiriisocius sp. Uisw_017 TaxID=3230968 RepID=UPI0039E7D0FA